MCGKSFPSALLQRFFPETHLWVVTRSLEAAQSRAGRRLGDRLSHAPHSAFIQVTEGTSSGPDLSASPQRPTQVSWRGRSDPEALSTWLGHFFGLSALGIS